MTKPRRDRDAAHIRRSMLIYAGVAFCVGLVMAPLRLPHNIAFTVVLAGMSLSIPLSLRQYYNLDEFGRLRFFKSWAFAGQLTAIVTTILFLYAAIGNVEPRAMFYTYAFTGLYIVNTLGALGASFYLHWRDTRE